MHNDSIYIKHSFQKSNFILTEFQDILSLSIKYLKSCFLELSKNLYIHIIYVLYIKDIYILYL